MEEAGVGDYLKRSASQVVMGNFTEDVTLAGTGIQVTLGLLGLDAPMDIRDIAADFVNWEWSWGHAGQTALDIVALIPLVGAVKYTDEAATLIKNANKGTDILKNSDEVIDVVDGTKKIDFYVKPNGDAVPSTGYRYMDTKYAQKTFDTNRAPGSYFSFDKFDSASEARDALQISSNWSNAGLRGEFDTLQVIDDIRIPYEYGDTGMLLEPFTKSYPDFGSGGYTQAITESWIQFKPNGLKILDK